MSKLRVMCFGISFDGYGAGPDQSLENPLGVRGPELGSWLYPTRMWKTMYGQGPDETGVDNGFAEKGFVTDGIHSALDQAKAAAGARDVRLGGGVATIRQYLQAGLIDDLHFAMQPVLLGRGEPLLQGLDLDALGYECAETVAGERATHVLLRKRA